MLTTAELCFTVSHCIYLTGITDKDETEGNACMSFWPTYRELSYDTKKGKI